MISFEEARQMVLGEVLHLPAEEVKLKNALDRFLAEDVVSGNDLPPFDKSAVDGYAMRREDLSKELEVIGTIAAGVRPSCTIATGQCYKIMTGAMVPVGADCIIMVEDTRADADNRVRFTGEKTGTNICYRGEDVKNGQKVLDKGIRIQPQHQAILASVGLSSVKVSSKIKVGILSTGDELVEPGRKLTGAKIRNSNSWQLAGQVTRAGGIPASYGIAKDKKDELLRKMSRALDGNHIVLVSGGVSMGDLDYVPDVFRELGVNIVFHGVTIQPGRPVLFGAKDGHVIFGLPGNPVSSFVLFEMLVRPFMTLSMGGIHEEAQIRLPLGEDFNRKNASRKAFIPVKIVDGNIYPVEYHGSAHIHAYAEANGIISMEKGVTELRKGEITYVRQI